MGRISEYDEIERTILVGNETSSHTLHTYIFASLRGDDFKATGKDPHDALQNLQAQEMDNGSLWRLNDPHRNRCAVEKQGFTCIKPGDFYAPVYKLVL